MTHNPFQIPKCIRMHVSMYSSVAQVDEMNTATIEKGFVEEFHILQQRQILL